MTGPFKGVLVPVVTPFDADLAPDSKRFVALCQALLDAGAAGLAVFGTTSEANSLTAGERKALLQELVAAGVPGARLMPGIGACSFMETVELLTQAAELGCAGALMLPPFYYKGAAASDAGLFDFTAEVLRRTEGAETALYLYHIPPVAQVGWSAPLIARLREAFGPRIAGLKDSSGDWSNTQALLEGFTDFDVFPGSEVFLLQGLRAGGAGCITATGNLNPAGIDAVFQAAARGDAEAEALQERASQVRRRVQDAGALIPTIKAYLALKSGDPAWARVRPPLRAADAEAVRRLDRDLDALGFDFSLRL